MNATREVCCFQLHLNNGSRWQKSTWRIRTSQHPAPCSCFQQSKLVLYFVQGEIQIGIPVVLCCLLIWLLAGMLLVTSTSVQMCECQDQERSGWCMSQLTAHKALSEWSLQSHCTTDFVIMLNNWLQHNASPWWVALVIGPAGLMLLCLGTCRRCCWIGMACVALKYHISDSCKSCARLTPGTWSWSWSWSWSAALHAVGGLQESLVQL